VKWIRIQAFYALRILNQVFSESWIIKQASCRMWILIQALCRMLIRIQALCRIWIRIQMLLGKEKKPGSGSKVHTKLIQAFYALWILIQVFFPSAIWIMIQT
jgi:hypothetical protein